MQFGVIYLKTWGGTEPYVVFSTFFWGGGGEQNTHGTEFSYIA